MPATDRAVALEVAVLKKVVISAFAKSATDRAVALEVAVLREVVLSAFVKGVHKR
jgi:hypothetical protein